MYQFLEANYLTVFEVNLKPIEQAHNNIFDVIYCNIFLAVLHCSQEMCQLCTNQNRNKENKVI